MGITTRRENPITFMIQSMSLSFRVSFKIKWMKALDKSHAAIPNMGRKKTSAW
jgi:hypothetical protein